MREVPDPDEFEVKKECVQIRDEELITVRYPNSLMAIDAAIDGIRSDIDEMRQRNDFEWHTCTNCSDIDLAETKGEPCQECFEASLVAAEEWAAEYADKLLGDEL